jgi:hypothetical protein
MKLRQKYTGREFEANDTEDLVRICTPYSQEEAIIRLGQIIARILDRLELTPQQKLDIIDPYSDLDWEIGE